MILTETTFDPTKLHRHNVLLEAQARRHVVRSYAGPFSIKTVVRGQAQWKVGGRTYTVEPGRFLIVGNGEAYDMDIDAPQPVRTSILFFGDVLVAEVATVRQRSLRELLEDPSRRDDDEIPITGRLWEWPPPLELAFAALREHAGRPGGAQGAFDAYCRALLDLCADLEGLGGSEQARIRAAKAATRKELHRRVLMGKAHMDETFTTTYDLDRIAAKACLAPHHFHRTFKEAFLETPFAYTSRRRLERVARLLRETDLPVGEICISAGWESQATLANRFKTRYGVSPTAYRRRGGKGVGN